MPEIKINSVTMSYAKEKSLDSINAVIGEGAVVGGRPEETPSDKWGIAVVASGRHIGKGCTVAPRAMIEEDLREEEN